MRKQQKKVSIIIPAYNTEEYLEESLKSVVQQTYTNLEIIIVNDGSTDKTLSIISEFSKKDKRIKIINQENKGVSIARNNGFNASSGDYILFIDSDDIMGKNMIELMVDNLEKNNADISICGYERISINGTKEKSIKIKEKKLYNTDEAIVAFFNNNFGISMWDKLIRREIANKISFEDGKKINEDKYYLFNAIINSNKIVFDNKGLYKYMEREKSVTRKKFGKNNLDIIYFSRRIKKIIIDKYPQYKHLAIKNEINDLIYIYRNIVREYDDKDEMYIKAVEIRNDLKNYDKLILEKVGFINKFELYLICKYNNMYKNFLKIYDKTIRKWCKQ